MIRRLFPLLLLVAATASARVVLVSFDGFGADELAKRHGLRTIERLERQGELVRRVTPVTPSVTSAAHVAILTGTPPAVNGIVGNKFHIAGAPWGQIADGFTADIHGETLVEAAHRQGKRVGSIAFPTIDARNARRTADFGLVFSDPVEKPKIVHMSRAGLRRYRVGPDGWFAAADGFCGSWSKVVSTTADDATVYWGPKTCTEGYPESFREMVTREEGFWPGPPDPSADPQTFAEQNARLGRFLARVTSLAIRRMPFDLLLTYEPIVDSAEHRYLGSNERVVSRSFEAADRALATIVAALDPAKDDLVVTGDHGLAHLDAEVHLKALIGDPAWLPIATGGGVAHLYKTAPADDEALIDKLAATGWFERIERKPSANAGDLVLYAWPDVALSADDGEPVTRPKPHASAQHGGIGAHHELQTVLIAWGAGVKHGVIAAMQQTEVAPLVSRLLGIEPPRPSP